MDTSEQLTMQTTFEFGERDTIGGNGGPALDDAPTWRRTVEEAQADPKVERRPSYLCRYAGKGAPARVIVGVAGQGAFGTRVLLACGHWREIRDYLYLPELGRKRPTRARCGLCREAIQPDADSLAKAIELAGRV